MKQLLLPCVIDDDLRQRLIKFALKDGLGWFNQNSFGPNRRYVNLDRTGIPLAYRVAEFNEKTFFSLGLTDIRKEPLYGNFLAVQTEGAFVQEHTDARDVDEYWHVRLNFMLQKPEAGGIPIIEGNEYPIAEGRAWLNCASEWLHSSTPVVGNKERIVLSLGRYVNPEQVLPLLLESQE